MFVDMVVTRSMRIMATMVNTGVRLLDAIRVIEGVVDNYYFQRLWSQVDEKIQDGYQLSESIMIAEGSHLISPGIIQMLRAGEKSGRLGEVCDKVSIFYQKKLETSIRNVMTLIEPLMISDSRRHHRHDRHCACCCRSSASPASSPIDDRIMECGIWGA